MSKSSLDTCPLCRGCVSKWRLWRMMLVWVVRTDGQTDRRTGRAAWSHVVHWLPPGQEMGHDTMMSPRLTPSLASRSKAWSNRTKFRRAILHLGIFISVILIRSYQIKIQMIWKTPICKLRQWEESFSKYWHKNWRQFILYLDTQTINVGYKFVGYSVNFRSFWLLTFRQSVIGRKAVKSSKFQSIITKLTMQFVIV